jgi:hypothetical protein
MMNMIDDSDEYWEKKSEAILKMSLKELREMSKNSIVIFKNQGDIVPQMEEDETPEEAALSDLIQSMSLKELRALKKTHRLVVTPTQEEKIKITGLSAETIERLETRKEKATLEEIMIYCNRLHISFQQFLPELFLSYQ